MEFVQPLMLWAAGAVVIPVILHFWHQKQGKTLSWAATRWLQEKAQQQQRGIRLDNLLLLLLRCLLVVLLALLLSQPVASWFTKKPEIAKIHLVQPEKEVVDNFRFELENAVKKGEAVYWMNAATEPAPKPTELPEQRTFTLAGMQSSINALLGEQAELHLYLKNDDRFARAPFIRVPATYQLHVLADSSKPTRQNYIALPGGKKLFVNGFNQLVSSQQPDQAIRLQSAPMHSAPVTVLVNFRNGAEKQTVLAALSALSEVYALSLQIDQIPQSDKKYDWILTDREEFKPSPKTLYVVSGKLKMPTVSNVMYAEDKLMPQTAELVRTGRLPEWLGELLVRHFNLKTNPHPIPSGQLKRLFIATAKPDEKQPETVRNGLLLVFVMVLGVERWVALKKNA